MVDGKRCLVLLIKCSECSKCALWGVFWASAESRVRVQPCPSRGFTPGEDSGSLFIASNEEAEQSFRLRNTERCGVTQAGAVLLFSVRASSQRGGVGGKMVWKAGQGPSASRQGETRRRLAANPTYQAMMTWCPLRACCWPVLESNRGTRFNSRSPRGKDVSNHLLGG